MMEICFSPDTYIEKRKVFLLLLQREPLNEGVLSFLTRDGTFADYNSAAEATYRRENE